jgi:ankyrin repeat protein
MLLAAEGIDICAKDDNQTAVLLYTCHCGNIEIVKALLAALKETSNFDINDKNDKNANGYTALMWACIISNVEVIKLLLSVPRINTHLKDNLGKTALDCVKGTSKEDEIKALFQGELLPLPLQIKSANCIDTHSPPLLLTQSPLYSHLNESLPHSF